MNQYECECSEKQIISEGDNMFIARETVCPKHGYQTSCYLCDSENLTTERCRMHVRGVNDQEI